MTIRKNVPHIFAAAVAFLLVTMTVSCASTGNRHAPCSGGNGAWDGSGKFYGA